MQIYSSHREEEVRQVPLNSETLGQQWVLTGGAPFTSASWEFYGWSIALSVTGTEAQKELLSSLVSLDVDQAD